MINNIIQKEQQLFDEWRESSPNFCEDGIIEPSSYAVADSKILFLLKEVNSTKEFNLKQFVKDGGRTQTWDNIARWTYGILNWQNDYYWNKDIEPIKNKAIRKELLKFIGVMNIKKTPGGHTSNSKILWEDSLKDKDFLNRQFELYYNNPKLRPDFIIGCGTATSNFFHEIVPFCSNIDYSMTSRGVKYYEYEMGKFFVKFAHPEARVADNLLYYGLIDAVKELKRIRTGQQFNI